MPCAMQLCQMPIDFCSSIAFIFETDVMQHIFHFAIRIMIDNHTPARGILGMFPAKAWYKILLKASLWFVSVFIGLQGCFKRRLSLNWSIQFGLKFKLKVVYREHCVNLPTNSNWGDFLACSATRLLNYDTDNFRFHEPLVYKRISLLLLLFSLVSHKSWLGWRNWKIEMKYHKFCNLKCKLHTVSHFQCPMTPWAICVPNKFRPALSAPAALIWPRVNPDCLRWLFQCDLFLQSIYMVS